MSVLVAILVIYGSMFFIGVPANGFLIWVFYKMSMKRRRAGQKGALGGFTSTDLLLLGLAAINFTACVTSPLNIGFRLVTSNDWMCKYVIFMSRLACLSALFVTVALAVFRYRIVLCNSVKESRNLWIVGTVYILCLILAFLTHTAVLVHAKYEDDQFCLPFGGIQSQGLWIYRGIVVGIFAVCLTTVTSLYARILWFLRKSRSRRIHHLVSPKGVKKTVTEAWSEKPKVPSKNTPQVTIGTRSSDEFECSIETGVTTIRDPCAAASKDIPTVSGQLRDKPEQITDAILAERRPAQAVKPTNHIKATKMIMILTLIIYLAWMPYIMSIIFGRQFSDLIRTTARPQLVVGTLTFFIRLREVIHIANLFVYIAANDRFRKTAKESLDNTLFSKCLR
ncbi:uncharacterized protein LOC135156755 [Lytechinus pictus]|uniref:uncharacterized protein LOC135156755 n=1 Tax=Lytechinus pictus TaxID=7653 RepID=UPI0030BA21FC